MAVGSRTAPAKWRSPAMDIGTLGPAMAKLNPRQQAFVDYVVSNGTTVGGFSEAARAVGYLDHNPDTLKHTAHFLTKNDKVKEAIAEEVKRRMGLGLAAVHKAVLEVAADKTHKDFGKLSMAVLAMAGLSPVAKSEVTVRHEGGSLVEQMKADCAALGIDYEQFIRSGQMKDVTPKPKMIEHQPIKDDPYGLRDIL